MIAQQYAILRESLLKYPSNKGRVEVSHMYLQSQSPLLHKLWLEDAVVAGDEGQLLDEGLAGQLRHHDLHCPRQLVPQPLAIWRIVVNGYTVSFSKVVLSQGAVNQVFLGVFLMFLAVFHSKIWAQFHFGTFKPYKYEKSFKISSSKWLNFWVGSKWHIHIF